MRRQILQYSTLTLVMLGAVAVAAGAQEGDRARTRTYTYTVGPGDMGFSFRRGRMGINVDLRPNAATDSIGARVAGLTPDGAAGRAGVQVGDIITRVNGTRLTAADPADRDDDDDDQSRPAMRLLHIASRLDPGDTVRLDVRRGTQSQTFTFVAQESDADRMVQRMRMPMLQDMHEMGGGPNVRVFVGGDGPSDIELVKVNAGLAEYFGTSEGLLVVDVGADTSLNLRAGDVILSIGGRRPTSPAHAMRILSTYDSGETVPFEIMRQKRRANITGRLPRREDNMHWRVEPNSFEMPALPDFEPMFRDFERQFRDLEPSMRRQFHLQVPNPEIRLDQPQLKIRVDGWT